MDEYYRAIRLLPAWLAQPLAEGERLAVSVRGRMHPDTGRLLQTPAEILHDVLANLARAPVQWADLDDYRTETAHIVLGGLLADNSISIRAAIDGLLQSCGGAWAAAMPGVAITWPPLPDDAAPALRVDKLTAQGLQASTTAQGLHTAVIQITTAIEHDGLNTLGLGALGDLEDVGPQQRLAPRQDQHRHPEGLQLVHHPEDLIGAQLAGEVLVGRDRITVLAGEVAAPDEVPDHHRARRVALRP